MGNQCAQAVIHGLQPVVAKARPPITASTPKRVSYVEMCLPNYNINSNSPATGGVIPGYPCDENKMAMVSVCL